MSQETSMLNASAALARHAAYRQTVLSNNMANADTPGFRAQDVAAFTLGADGVDFASLRTRSGHFSQPVDTVAVTGIASPDGNSVTLEDQMIRAADTRRSHDMATTLFRKSIDLLRLGLGRGR